MKFIKIALSAVVVSLFCATCSPDSTTVAPELTVTGDSTVELTTPEATDIEVSIEANATVAVSSDRSWCKVEAPTTTGGEFTISTTTNTGRFERSARVTFANGDLKQQIVVEQPKGVYTPGMRYEIPVVFHIVYNDESSRQHNVESAKIYEIFDKLVDIYDNCGQDVGIDFVLAEEDEEGVTLAEPGIHRIKQALYKMECLKVMNDPYNKYTHLAWDPRKYLNVTIYEFSDNFEIIGYSRTPFLVDPYELEGVEQLKEYEHPDDMGGIYTISLNNKYLYPEKSEAYNMYDFGETVAHEIGHCLGLWHPYSEVVDNTGAYNSCEDTDNCLDTPSYNRYLYEEEMFNISMFHIYTEDDIETLSWRTSCADGSVYRANNVMDYAINDSDTFTAGQVERMRYILENSPYIPGCKSMDFEALQPEPTGMKSNIKPDDAATIARLTSCFTHCHHKH